MVSTGLSMTVDNFTDASHLCAYHEGPAGPVVDVELACMQDTARFIYIFNDGHQALSLCEVEVIQVDEGK